MKFSLLPLAALLYLTTAQLDSLPPCAKQCANNLPQQCTNGGSSIGLIQCICSDKSWLEGISCCVKDKCSASDIQSTIKAAQQLCATGGVTLPSTLPPCASSSGSAAATGTSSGATTAGGTDSTSMSMSMNGTASTTGTAGTVSKQSGSSSSTPTSSSMSGTSSPTAKSTGGAAQLLGSNLGAAGAVLAAVALL